MTMTMDPSQAKGTLVTHLPPMETARMKIVSYDLGVLDSVKMQLDIDCVIRGEDHKYASKLTAQVHCVDDAEVGGRLPSKVLVDGESLVLMYYIHPGLGPAVRPFGDRSYVFWFLFDPNLEYSYDPTLRLFIDHVQVGDQYVMIVMAGESELAALKGERELPEAVKEVISEYSGNA